jgi:protocatechuate 3,4-dioxygenase beta subunit
VPGVEVQLIDRGQPPGIGVRTTRAGKDGHFEFAGVAPGQYLVFAHATTKSAKAFEAPREVAKVAAADLAGAPGTPADQEKKRQLLAAALAASAELWGMTDVSGDGHDLDGVTIVLQPGLTVSGHVVAESGTGASPNLGRLMLAVEQVGQSMAGERFDPPPALVDANGDFVIRGVFPGRYRLAIADGAPSGYMIGSAVFGGQDIMDLPFRLTTDDKLPGGLVTLSNRATEVTGTVQDGGGQPASGVTLIAYSADERLWTPDSRRIQATRPATDGKYVFRNLPPGEYRLAAVDDIEPGRWFDPAVLRAVAGFSTLTVLDGGKLTQDIRIK